MKNLHKLFVSYDTALILKEKGFNEPCIAYYSNKVDEPSFCENRNIFGDYVLIRTLPQRGISAPLFQQIINWLDEKHSVHFSFIHSNDIYNEYTVRIYKDLNKSTYTSFYLMNGDNDFDESQMMKVFISYTEALDNAIERALKLI